MAQHNELGRWGEEKAAAYLETQGYRIVERDWKAGRRDLDIVAVDTAENVLAVVEVKTRRNEFYMDAAASVDYRKVRNLTLAANYYVKSHYIDLPVRFDIITVVGTSDDDVKIDHIKEAFLPPTFYR